MIIDCMPNDLMLDFPVSLALTFMSSNLMSCKFIARNSCVFFKMHSYFDLSGQEFVDYSPRRWSSCKECYYTQDSQVSQHPVFVNMIDELQIWSYFWRAVNVIYFTHKHMLFVFCVLGFKKLCHYMTYWMSFRKVTATWLWL